MEKANKLINEKSPYLLQHAYNPVDWYPWNEEAFKKAEDEDKPVFLSIGYSTCHWCHVMEKESFEDEEIAKLMNDVFVSIKVDREERPDIDSVYMAFCQMLTGGGGWPMTIIMTPDKKPFFAGTYFPKESRFGRPGMKELIPHIKELWLTKRNEILNSSEQVSSAVVSSSKFIAGTGLDENIFKIAFKEFQERYDEEFGGFGSAPKFPSPHNLMFLLRYWKRYNNDEALEMVEKTLTEIRKGGIYDHLGFGFSRYSTDKEWLVPHFEKMLYDQALLLMAYIETYQATNQSFYKETAEEILSYITRDMTSDEGGFYSAEDADSDGEEGKFYLWTLEEIKKICGEDSGIFIKYFNVKEKGNWVDTVNEEKSKTNILHITRDIKEFAYESGLSENELKEKLEDSKQKLFAEREKRIHPYKDDKILTDWNGLMISAFAKAAQVINNESYLDAAKKAADFILAKMLDENGKLLHRYRKNESAVFGNVDDYAFFIQALLDLYEATFDSKYIKQALNLNEDFINHFWDMPEGRQGNEFGGFFFTPDYGEKLIVRQKEIYDGAVPSGNSVAMLNLIRIARITANSSFEEKADLINKTFSSYINKFPSGFTWFLIALDFAVGPSKEIIISGNDYDLLRQNIFKKFIPAKIVLQISSGKDSILKDAPYLKNYLPADKTKVYVCENYICNIPVENIEKLEKTLSNR